MTDAITAVAPEDRDAVLDLIAAEQAHPDRGTTMLGEERAGIAFTKIASSVNTYPRTMNGSAPARTTSGVAIRMNEPNHGM